MKSSKFKMTELGPIPEGWEVKRLGDVAETSSGGTPSRARSDYFQGTIKWFTTTELLDCKLYDSIEHISNEALKNSSAKVFPPRTLLMAMYGATIGRLGVLQNHASTNQACCAIFCGDALFPDYAYYYLYHLRPNIIERGCGAGQPNISQEIVRSLPVVLPPLPEQEKIAEALSDVDALLSAMTTLIEKKRAIKQGAMQELLTGKTRLQGFGAERAEFKQTELGPIPMDWEVKRLGDVCSDYAYGTGAEAVDYDGENKYIRITDIDEDSHLYSPSPLVSPSFFSDGHIVKENDLLIARTGASVGKTYFYSKSDGKLIFAGFLMKANVKHAEGKFIFYLTMTDNYKRWVLTESARSGQPGVNIRQLQSLLLPIPPLAEQKAIAAVLSDMDAEIAALEAKRAKYESIKQGMMQELLTGKTRLVKGEGK